MTAELDAVERALLALVEKGDGRWGWHELEVRLGGVELPRRDYDAQAMLRAFEQRGLVERVADESAHARWRITATGVERLHGEPAAAMRAPALRPDPALRARSIAEEHLYLELKPCVCGRAGADGLSHELRLEDEQRLSRFVGRCPQCRRERDLSFALPKDEPPGGAFGGPEPSALLDAGELLAASDALARTVPADPSALAHDERRRAGARLERAVRLLDEVLKFIPPGADEPPKAALASTAARAIATREPGRFRRQRLEARRDALHALMLDAYPTA